MKYEVSEKKYYKIDDIIQIKEHKYELKHLETTFDLEKYELVVELKYINSFLEEKIINLTLPIELNTTMTEQLSAVVKELNISIVKNTGIDLDIKMDIEVNDIVEEKNEIKEIYQQELEEKLLERDIDMTDELIEQEEINEIIEDSKLNIESSKVIEGFDLIINLKTEYSKYKIISLDENALDKISSKYNLPIDYLYDMKKSNNKVIVHDKE